ncbi:MAG TPA: hypothetical protein VGL03_13545 [Thermoanaerobaculia bacterium]|jgi:Na+(H+)/acetate symporter ActP
MRRIGIILIVVGLAGFLLASSQRAGYDTVEGGIKAAFSSSERAKKDAWDTARWMLVGVAVIGVVFTVLPGKKS